MLKDVRPSSHRHPHVGLVLYQPAELACRLIEIIERRDSDVVRIVVVRNLDVIIFLAGDSDLVCHVAL